jgi:UMF1 family MFS transporter
LGLTGYFKENPVSIIETKSKTKEIFAWTLYDFANSAFTTLIVTFIYATYFVKAIAPDEITGTVLWSRAVTASALTVAVLSPLLGAVADHGGYRKRFLIITSWIAILGSIVLYGILPGAVLSALIWFFIANVGFELGMIFYNAYLPEIAQPSNVGRISGYGWSLGYVGGLLAMFIAMVGFVQPEIPWFGLSHEVGQNIRATNLLVAAWFALFSLPIFLLIPERRTGFQGSIVELSGEAVERLIKTFRQIKQYSQILLFLIARMIYNDGLVTIFAFGGIYAAGTFDFTFQEIMIFGIALNVAAGAGAFILGLFDDRLGGRTTILISLIGLLAATILAATTNDRTMFWIAGIGIGLLVGPNQSASRALMARFTPPDKRNEFFGFFAFSGKATAFLGPLLFGIFTGIFNSQRAGIWIIAVLFVVGGLILLRVNESKGISQARE